MIVKRADLQAFGATPEACDDFFEQLEVMRRAGRTDLISPVWICNTLGICPCRLLEMVDAGLFPPPAPNG
jgi:hypothetical protein